MEEAGQAGIEAPQGQAAAGGVGGAEWDMSAPISSEDIAKAGGLGATDGIASVVPVAADATDFEETLMEFGAPPASHEGVGFHGQPSGAGAPDGGLAGEGLSDTGTALGGGGGNPGETFLESHFTRPVVEPTE